MARRITRVGGVVADAIARAHLEANLSTSMIVARFGGGRQVPDSQELAFWGKALEELSGE